MKKVLAVLLALSMLLCIGLAACKKAPEEPTQAPEEPTAEPVEEPTKAPEEATAEPAEKPTEKPAKKGCGSFAAGTLAVVCLAGAALAIVRKKH